MSIPDYNSLFSLLPSVKTLCDGVLRNRQRLFGQKTNYKPKIVKGTHMKHLKPSIKFQTTILPLLIFALGSFALCQMAQAVGPDTDGAIPGSNNGEGIGVLVSRTTGIWNTGTGFEALNHLTAGNQNTATGLRALFSDTNGGFNTATGVYALFSNTTGFFNSATGAYSLAHNTTGFNNTANGYGALYLNTTGSENTATGFQALYWSNDSWNTANGSLALYNNTTGNGNTAVGSQALYTNTHGSLNTAIGYRALPNNTIGGTNVALGANALAINSTGNDNTATGFEALVQNSTGNFNTANGRDALSRNNTGNFNTANGSGTLSLNTTGSNNTALGFLAGGGVTTANNVIAIGSNVFGENVSNTCYIGNIFGVTSAGATAVYVNSLGKLGTVVSSRRFKEEVKPMDKASEAILALKPVTFRYKQEIDPARSPQFGLVAEEVEKIDPDLVVRDGEGKVNTVRYEAVNAMLLNEFLKEHRKVEKLEAALDAVSKRLKEQDAKIQKVSDQVELSKTTPQVVSSKP
jgi:hypothetical protein